MGFECDRSTPPSLARALALVLIAFAALAAQPGSAVAQTSAPARRADTQAANAACPTPSTTEVFLGAAACASGMCHGSIVARTGTHVSQNEYHVWSRRDAHSRAYRTLSSERSLRIARNLGLASAETAGECLACHALDVPAARRGPRFQISDGVSCEACHGAADAWIETHEDADTTHATNVACGMIALDAPDVRAAVCIACHQGAGDRAVTHRLMAAGHPRLSFELDTFTYLQPKHFEIDADYRRRKQAPDSATVWAAGQAASVRAYADLLGSPRSNRTGVWPEFSLFDCFGCHHAIGTMPPSAAAAQYLPLGLPRLGASSLVLYGELSEQLAPEGAADFAHDLAALQSSVGGDRKQLGAAATRLAERTASDARRLATMELEHAQLEALLARVTSAGAAARYRTYADAEQATMAVQALVATLAERDALGSSTARLQSALDALFEATSNEESFRAGRFGQALAKVRDARR